MASFPAYHSRLVGGQCSSIQDHRIEFAMKRRLLSPGITSTQRFKGFWLTSIYGTRVGTVEGNGSRRVHPQDIDYHFMGSSNVSAKAALQAWVQQ